jgi:carbamate kinase
MSETVVILVNGEVLANGQGSTIASQRQNAQQLADGLAPLLASDVKVAILHGNKPQVGFVLFRSECVGLHAVAGNHERATSTATSAAGDVCADPNAG